MVAGAVYRPLDVIVPAPLAGLMVHVTDVFDEFVTVAVNCWLCPALNEAVWGVTATETVIGGLKVMVAVPVVVPSKLLTAVTVTF